MFRRELRLCVKRKGRISQRLYSLGKDIAKLMKGDSQESEGVQNMLKRELLEAPRMGLKLLDAKIGIKKWWMRLLREAEAAAGG